MHVCWITTSFPRYEGDHAGVWFLGLAKGLIEQGVKLTVIAPHDAGIPYHEVVHGMDVHRFPYWWPGRLQQLCYGYGMPQNVLHRPWVKAQLPPLLLAGALSCIRNSRQADLIHAFWTLNSVIGAPAASIRGLPMLLTILGSGVRSAPRWLNRIAVGRSDAIVSATAEQIQHLRPYDYRGPLVDIKQTNMVDRQRMEDSRPLEPELADWCAQASFVVTFAGNLSSFKDPLGFLRAIPEILKKHGKTCFLVVGDGPLRAEVESEVERLGLGGSVRLTGARDDIASLLRASTVFVANSPVSNCYSATIIEAMEIGVPCVVSDAGDPSGSFTAKDYVESVRPNDPADLARGIVRLLDDLELRRRRVRMGRSFIEDLGFTPDAVIGRTMETYQALLEKRHLDLANWPPHLMNYTD